MAIDSVVRLKPNPDSLVSGNYAFPASAGQDVTVFILDSGITPSLSEFGGRAVRGPTFANDSTDVRTTEFVLACAKLIEAKLNPLFFQTRPTSLVTELSSPI